MRNRVFLTTAYLLSLMSDPAIAVKDVKRWVKFSLGKPAKANSPANVRAVTRAVN